MIKIIKGNLYDWKLGRLNSRLYDSSDYDVKIISDEDTFCFRRRYDRTAETNFVVYRIEDIPKMVNPKEIVWDDLDKDIQKIYLNVCGYSEEDMETYLFDFSRYTKKEREKANKYKMHGYEQFTLEILKRIGDVDKIERRCKYFAFRQFKKDDFTDKDERGYNINSYIILKSSGLKYILDSTAKEHTNIAWTIVKESNLVKKSSKEFGEICMYVMIRTGISEEIVELLAENSDDELWIERMATNIVIARKNTTDVLRKNIIEDSEANKGDFLDYLIPNYFEIENIFDGKKRKKVLYDFLMS